MKQVAIGSIHGRFQPFHNGHKNYLNEALKRSKYLIIGITQFDIENLEVSTLTHRSKKENNPLTYNQRCHIIKAYLDSIQVNTDKYEFRPFPIDTPEKLYEFIPYETVCFTTLHHAIWNQNKIEKLKDAGFITEILLHPDHTVSKELSASTIRDFIRKKDPAWEILMPEPCVKALKDTNGVEAILNF